MIGATITLAAICIAAIIAMHHVRRASLEDPTPLVVMHVMGGMTDPHGRWVVLMPGVRCDCPSTEHVDVTTRCGERATLHHCHKGDHA